MPQYFSPKSAVLFLSLLIYVTWGWVQSIGSAENHYRKWRFAFVLAALCFATLSTILSVFLFAHASYTAGYPFYHPVELFCIRFGALTALLGLIASLAGKGRLRPHIAAMSAINLLLWFVDAMAQ